MDSFFDSFLDSFLDAFLDSFLDSFFVRLLDFPAGFVISEEIVASLILVYTVPAIECLVREDPETLYPLRVLL